MIKYYCDRCGAEILFDEVVKMEMSYISEWIVIGESLKYNNSVMCPKCLAEFNKFMREGSRNKGEY